MIQTFKFNDCLLKSMVILNKQNTWFTQLMLMPDEVKDNGIIMKNHYRTNIDEFYPH